MSGMLPKGEKLRRAVRWISGERDGEEARSLRALVQDATLRFDLTPRESEMLMAFYREGGGDGGASGG